MDGDGGAERADAERALKAFLRANRLGLLAAAPGSAAAAWAYGTIARELIRRGIPDSDGRAQRADAREPRCSTLVATGSVLLAVAGCTPKPEPPPAPVFVLVP